jgi:uncharacterized protein (TIGR00255 family)
VSLPRFLVALESKVHGMLHKGLARGSVNASVRVSFAPGEGRGNAPVDVAKARAYVRELREAARECGLKDDLSARSLLSMPDVVRAERVPDDTLQIWPVVEKALKQALRELLAMRRSEGVALGEDLATRLQQLRKPFRRIRELSAGVTRRHARTLRERLAQAGLPIKASDPELRREIALFAERADISEEIVRLESHFKQAATLMKSRQPAGRALDFLCQEMFREINTIGSKANDGDISQQVIKFKAGLEAIREQAQNVE